MLISELIFVIHNSHLYSSSIKTKKKIMKKLLLLFVAVLTVSLAKAQVPDYGICPDITIVDLDGNSYRLYDILDEGKSVVLDLYAEWCGPCWSYHTGGTLETLYSTYGPAGTNELMVFGVESDPGTPITAISGGVGSTNGWDWLDGIEYPMANSNTIANAFNLEYYPTIVLVCPNRRVTEVSQITVAQHYAAASACGAAASDNNDGSIIAYTGEDIACGDVPMSAIIYNAGLSTLTGATVKVMNGSNELASVNWTGQLASYAYAEVDFGDVTITPGNYQVKITSSDDNASNNSYPVQLIDATVVTLNIALEVTTDYYPGETSWEITNSNGTTVAEGEYVEGTADQFGGGGLDASKTHVHNVTLPVNECYTMWLYDSFGDGMSYTGGGSALAWGYKIRASWGGILLSQDGDFTDEVKGGMQTTATSGIEETELAQSMSVYPNPAVDNAMITFNTAEKSNIAIEVINAVGARVMSKSFGTMNAGTQMIPLATSGLSSGIYLVNVYVNDSVITKRLSVEK